MILSSFVGPDTGYRRSRGRPTIYHVVCAPSLRAAHPERERQQEGGMAEGCFPRYLCQLCHEPHQPKMLYQREDQLGAGGC